MTDRDRVVASYEEPVDEPQMGLPEGQVIQLALRPPARPLQGGTFEALRIIRDYY